MVIQMGMFGKYIVCYDVEDNKRRSKFFDFLKDIGLFPVQKSVFYGDLNAAELRSLKTAARKMLKSESNHDTQGLLTAVLKQLREKC